MMKQGAFLVVLSAVLWACSHQPLPHAQRPAVNESLPLHWSTHTAQDAVIPFWLTSLSTPELRQLWMNVLQHNPTLQAAAARVEQSRWKRAELHTNSRPQWSSELKTTRGRQQKQTESRQRLGFDVAWEWDVWDRLTSESAESDADWQAMQADWQAAKWSLLAQLAKHWFTAVGLQQKQRLLDQTIASLKHNLNIVETGYQRGIGQALDVHLINAELARARSRQLTIRRDRQIALRTLDVLSGHYPSGLLSPVEELPLLTAAVPAGLPGSFLQRRPDIRAAGQRLEAAFHQQQHRLKASLPAIRLSAEGGLSSDSLKLLLQPGQLIWQLGAGLTYRLFDGERQQAEAQRQQARLQEYVADYRRVVLDAFREVEVALSAESLLRQQQVLMQRAVSESKKAEQLALGQYQSGLSTVVTLLEAQRRHFEARISLLKVRQERLQNRLNLHLALAGGFVDNETETAREKPSVGKVDDT